MELDSQDKIDDYVMGKMSMREQQYFHKVITNDENLQEQLELTQHIMHAVIKRSQKLTTMKIWNSSKDMQ